MAHLHDQIAILLNEMGACAPFLAIHSGEEVPPLTDYFVRRLPDEWNAQIPPELVNGRTLTPLFVGCDSYAIYCVDNDTYEIAEIDPEDPWPPTQLYADWHAFVQGAYSSISQDSTDAEKATLREFLKLTPN